MKRLLFFTAVLCSLTIPSIAAMYVEDFEYPQPAGNFWTTTDGIFTHRITTASTWEFTDLSSYPNPADGQALALWPGYDAIIFNLPQGQYVDNVSLDYAWLGGTVEITINGDLDSYTLPVSGDYNIWKSLDTTGMGLGKIFRIDLTSDEGAFDNITINVVPEPATLVLLGLGGLLLRTRK